MNDMKFPDGSPPRDVELMRCCGRMRPLRAEAFLAVDRLKAACREEARQHREEVARAIALYTTPLPVATHWHPPPVRPSAPHALISS